ncbi:hypothetical protein RhiirC2_802121 [Rhizophagus irregularis]|uniref:Crinkler effector protein N-terminal domain-containing protein n=1 Tax=Rhizophagus irregularis TaxID=588596 RepID=A0A2N1M1Q4_9GLOM|nr:hypothetical protein RhiirC2_802121 [Rhizophagus irregularis]
MSSYSSLSRVLSPSRVQTKFEENSLPIRSNIVSKKSFTRVILKNYLYNPRFLTLDFCDCRYTEIMLGCLILGGSFFYLGINIQEVSNISFLKEEIKKKKENDFCSIDPDNLNL